MATFKIKTKNNNEIDKKPRVFFTCHPDDFEKYFDKICEDIFKTHDCAIYYTEDLSEIIAEDEKETDLGRMNLFVVPVTFKLLSQPNRAMDEDIHYAIKEHIPILPIMMESGIDEFYSKPDKFGELQYLNPYSRDLTEISYEEKLKKYLEAVLISDEMAERIRAAFDAYIFLSYRKKDRKYANQLMRLIHSHPEFRDIAIWFDEFLTPGESFRENIDKILQNSKLFTLLVTPNLLEEPDGKPNFVMGEEYPAARDSGMEILPAEMQETDKNILADKFEGIPECVKPEDEDFREKFLDIVAKTATEANNTPEHNFLIGLAYLDGIDVEINREFGIELITMAAEAGLVEAMEKLYDMYTGGIGIKINYREGIKWAERIVDYYKRLYGENDERTILALLKLLSVYIDNGEYEKALDLADKIYQLLLNCFGDESLEYLLYLNNLSVVYYYLGDSQKSLSICEKAYEIGSKLLDYNDPTMLIIVNNMALALDDIGKYKKALEMLQSSYELVCEIFGEDDPQFLQYLNNLSASYISCGKKAKGMEILERLCELANNVLGEEHPQTLFYMGNLATVYMRRYKFKKALKICKRVYEIKCDLLGDTHPSTIYSLRGLYLSYAFTGNFKEAVRYAILYDTMPHFETNENPKYNQTRKKRFTEKLTDLMHK